MTLEYAYNASPSTRDQEHRQQKPNKPPPIPSPRRLTPCAPHGMLKDRAFRD
jgi:hypothetical protein